MTKKTFFPAEFEDLERFAPEWVIADVVEKQHKRATTDLAAIKRFYAALYPEIDRIIGHLVGVPMDGMSEGDRNLYRLVATWNEMSHPVDLGWAESDEPGVFPYDRVKLWEESPV